MCRWLQGCVLLAVVLVFAVNATLGVAADRRWTDNQGRQIKAEFVRIVDETVVLKRGLQVVKVPFFNLSEEDREWVRKTMEAKGKGKLVPSDPPPQARVDRPQPGMMPAEQPKPEQPGMPFAGMGGGLRKPLGTPPTPPPGDLMRRNADMPLASSSPAPPSAPMFPPGVSNPPPNTARASAAPSPNMSPSFPPPPPNIESSIPGGPMFVEQKACMKCKKPVSDNAKAGDRCPHCGIVWDFEQLDNGMYRDKEGKVTSTPRLVRYTGFGALGTAVISVIIFLLRAVTNRK